MNRFQRELAGQLVKMKCTSEYDNKPGQMKLFNKDEDIGMEM